MKANKTPLNFQAMTADDAMIGFVDLMAENGEMMIHSNCGLLLSQYYSTMVAVAVAAYNSVAEW